MGLGTQTIMLAKRTRDRSLVIAGGLGQRQVCCKRKTSVTSNAFRLNKARQGINCVEVSNTSKENETKQMRNPNLFVFDFWIFCSLTHQNQWFVDSMVARITCGVNEWFCVKKLKNRSFECKNVSSVILSVDKSGNVDEWQGL